MTAILSSLFRQHAPKDLPSTNCFKRAEWIASKERILYFWTTDGLKAAFGVKYSTGEPETPNTHRKCVYGKEINLQLTVPPIGQVESLELNREGSCLAIRAERRVYVVYLPRQLRIFRTLGELESNYLCMSVSVDSELVNKNGGISCLRALWHPGCPKDRHLVTLWNDDLIRIYNLSTTPDTPVKTIVANSIDMDARKDGCFNNSQSRSFRSALGDAAVAFDFGAPIEQSDGTSVWPIFVLCGDGNVYCALTDIIKYRHHALIGPLRIIPATDDNYGLESCDILFLHGAVPVLIIATSYGILYHAIVQLDRNVVDAPISFLLHVFESVELEFALSTVDFNTSEVVPDDSVSVVTLKTDPHVFGRYYAYHNCGFHVIQLPLSSKTKDSIDVSEPSTVEYALCTLTQQMNDANHVHPIGAAIINSLSSDAAAVVLLSDFTLHTLPLSYDWLLTDFNEDARTSFTGSEGGGDAAPVASKRPINRDYFIDTIKRVLQKSSTLPLIKSQGVEIDEQECAQLLSRCLDVLRTEYIDRLRNADGLCRKRTAEIHELRAAQIREFMKLDDRKTRCRSALERQKTIYGERLDKHRTLSSRLNHLASSGSSSCAELSIAEEGMLKELDEMQRSLSTAMERSAQLKTKIDLLSKTGRNTVVLAAIAPYEAALKQRLSDQYAQIESLVNSVKLIQSERNM